ncbi:hypothetical protein [Kitasatospora sp. NPDC048538]|uniref:hypothetical protein n=1 Tax=unclassified Kitasatospora TaxID=2633591 RepID=UPI0033FE9237
MTGRRLAVPDQNESAGAPTRNHITDTLTSVCGCPYGKRTALGRSSRTAAAAVREGAA